MMPKDSIFNAHQKEEASKNRLVAFYRRRPRIVVGILLGCLVLFWLWGPRGQVADSHSVKEEYSVVFDAGSTGSRIHVYRFAVHNNGGLVLLHDDFHQIKPGLSSYAGKPNEAAESLTTLLDAVQHSVPSSVQPETPCQLKATAGLRLLSGNQASDILNAVQDKLEKTEYSVGLGAVSILDGSYEGAYAWLTLNYLLERLEGSEETVCAIDLGGGSVQESYEVPKTKTFEDIENTVDVHSSGTKRSVYVHSYLSYGLMAARALILESTGNERDNACIPHGYSGQYNYAGKDYAAVNKAFHSLTECRETIRGVMNLTEPCSAPIEECTFNGVWGGPIRRERNVRPVYLFSYFWDRALDAGIIESAEAITWEMQPVQFLDHAKKICGLSFEKLKTTFSSVPESQIPYLCMDLSYITVLLMDGFKLDPGQNVQLTKQIKYRGQNVETSWTLGAAIDGLATT